jgi:KDO2-lipid IV(A) lauroyltransferase
MFASQCAKIMIKKGFSHIGIFFLYILSLLPLSVLYFFATLIYYPLYYVFGYRKKVVRQNLQNSFPEKNLPEIIQIEKTFFKYLTCLVFEIIKMTTISKKELSRRFKFNNLELADQYLKKGESILACTGHYGNWEWGMLALGIQLSEPCYVIYKPLNNTIFDQWFYRIRTRFGNKFVAMKKTLRVLTATKNTPTMFCFAGDQTPIKEEAHYWINFLHQPTAVLLGLEKIAMQTNRPIFYFKLKVIKRGYYEVDTIPLCTVPKETSGHEIADKQFRILEEVIQEDPAYWLWSHRRWKHKPEHPEHGT